MKKSRFELSYIEMVRRSFYVFLRDELERRLKIITFEKPYKLCKEGGIPYPYVDPSDMRPKKREFSKESPVARPYIIIFCEETIEELHQKYIRFSDDNRIRKDTLALVPNVRLNKPFYSGIKFFERNTFFELLEELLDVDYGLLIQRDDRYKKQNRYSLTHFHVKIDWPIAEAAESLAKELRFISKSLYERGERYAETLQEKLFEHYGWHHQAIGGRRTYRRAVPQANHWPFNGLCLERRNAHADALFGKGRGALCRDTTRQGIRPSGHGDEQDQHRGLQARLHTR